MNNDLSRFYESFFDEVSEHLQRLEELIIEIDAYSPSREDLDSLFRVAHSIKGTSGTFGFADMADLTHVFESLLDDVRHGDVALDNKLVNLILRTGDVLRAQLNCYREGSQVDRIASATIARELEEQRLGLVPVAERAFTIRFHTDRGSDERSATFQGISDALRLIGTLDIREDGEAFEAELRTSRRRDDISDIFEYVKGEGDRLSIEERQVAERPPGIEDFGFFEDPTVPEDSRPSSTADVISSSAGDNSSVRVRLQKIDLLVNLVGELLIAQSLLSERTDALDPTEHADILETVDRLQRHTRDIREAVMSIRMLPVASVFGRFPRMVRELSEALGKNVRLETIGGETELDKALLEQVVDPLTHLIRNSLDHGIETPEERTASGKSPQGLIVMRASTRAGTVTIEVDDDGRGLDRERIIEKARERNMDVSDALTDREAWQLLFEPGFSTAESITDLSGRGVGMDVVKRNITQLGGRVGIEGAPSRGTRVSITLPLTLAILDGLSIRCGDDTFILPLHAIVESVPSSNATLVKLADGTLVMMFRNEAVRVCAPPGARVPERVDDGILVVVEADGTRVALLVDTLENEHQVVIKSLETNFRRITGFSGATVLGNGRVALILDVAALAKVGVALSPAATKPS